MGNKTEKRKYGISKDLAQDNLEMWIAASSAVASGQSYTIGTRTLTRADLSSILEMIDFWEDKVEEEETGEENKGRIRVQRIVPRDA